MSFATQTEHQNEKLITALDGLSRQDWDRDPAAWLQANNRLFDAMCAISGHAAVEPLSDDELRERAAIQATRYLTSGNA